MTVTTALARAAREPLVHFGLLGAAIFAAHAVFAPPREARIVVSSEFVAGLREEHRARTGKPPTAEEERALVDRFIEEESLYREAVALGLDRGDPIVRRRLAQKMAFVAEGSASREPRDEELRSYLAAHADRYRDAPRVSFHHVFLSRDRRGDAAPADAARALADLVGGADPARAGDPFLQGASFTRRTAAEITSVLGGAFSEALLAAPPGAWSGPITSSYGSHLVRVEERLDGSLPPLEAVRARVRADLLDERRAEAVRALRARVRARYAVSVEAPKVEMAVAR